MSTTYTRELEEVKDKPWIRQYWQENGLISDEKTHVYRAEISIKCDGMDLLNMSTGELFKLSPEYLQSQPSIEKLFHFYAARMFRFHRKGKHTRVRDYDRIELFENSPIITCKPKKVCVNGGKSVSSNTKFTGIEFGSGKSSKRCYIYDKTRELKEVKDKPRIRQYWQENGLISDEKTHVLS